MPRKQDEQHIYLGYFATILLALIAANYLGDLGAGPVAAALGRTDTGRVALYLTSGVFFAACLANPVGFIIQRRRAIGLLARIALGFGAGLALQHWIFGPVVGDGLTRLTQLLIASAGVPLMVIANRIGAGQRDRRPGRSTPLAAAVLRLASLPDRVLFIAMMAVSFSGFALFSASAEQAIAVIGIAMLAMTIVASRRSAGEFRADQRTTRYDAWLSLLPDNAPARGTNEEAQDAIVRVLTSLLPGAVFFGGLTWMAGEIMPRIHPAIWNGISGMSRAEMSGVVAMTGLGVVLAGAGVAVAIGIAMVQIAGHYGRWPRERRLYTCFWLLRAMSFRPMRRD